MSETSIDLDKARKALPILEETAYFNTTEEIDRLVAGVESYPTRR